MSKLALDDNQNAIQAFTFSNSTTKAHPITDASTTVVATDPKNSMVRIVATSDCFVSMGTAATITSMPLMAGSTEYFSRPQGLAIKVIGTDGILYVTEMN